MENRQGSSFARTGGEPLQGSGFEAETPALENPLTEIATEAAAAEENQ
jgi:hypothetical protein